MKKYSIVKKLLSVLVTLSMIAVLLPSGRVMKVQAADEISGLTYDSQEGCYLIQDAGDLADLGLFVNQGGDTAGKTFKQTQDITLTSDYTPIGHLDTKHSPYTYRLFSGTYDGNSKTIYGLKAAWLTYNQGGYDRKGLFGYAGNGAAALLRLGHEGRR